MLTRWLRPRSSLKRSCNTLEMDAGLIGGLIGVGVMVCIIGTATCYEKGAAYVAYWKKRVASYRQHRQPLLPVVQENPVLVRTSSKQWKMKELVASK